MPIFHLRFQSSGLVPPPYAYALEFTLNQSNLQYTFEINYLDRDLCDADEIEESGFSAEDDQKFNGKLNVVWQKLFNELWFEAKDLKKKEINEEEDYLMLGIDENIFYPSNYNKWIKILEELRQAVLEEQQLEAPLQIEIIRNDNSQRSAINFKASFLEQKFEIISDKQSKIIPWNKLNHFLKDLYTADFKPEKAVIKVPNKTGLFIHFEDNLWYELGFSYLTQPTKITKWLDF